MEPSRLTWRKASYSGTNGGGCVEVATSTDRHIGVRDSKNPDGGILVFNPGEWSAFVEGVRDGEFDL